MCITFVRETAKTDISKYTSWGCASTSTVFTVLADVIGGGSSSVNGILFPTANLQSIRKLDRNSDTQSIR